MSDGDIGSGINRGSYDAIAAEWDAARTSFHGSERRYLDRMLEGLPAHARILDLGCGTGRPMAEYLLERGHRITGVDQSEALLAIARSRFPEGEWIHSRIDVMRFSIGRRGLATAKITSAL